MNNHIPGLDNHLESRLERDSDKCPNSTCPACFCPRCMDKMTDEELRLVGMDLCPFCLTKLV